MSKHRPPHVPSTDPGAKAGVTPNVTSDSSHRQILRANVLTRLEIIRRQAFADLQALEAQLADMPPLAPREPPPANDG